MCRLCKVDGSRTTGAETCFEQEISELTLRMNVNISRDTIARNVSTKHRRGLQRDQVESLT